MKITIENMTCVSNEHIVELNEIIRIAKQHDILDNFFADISQTDLRVTKLGKGSSHVWVKQVVNGSLTDRILLITPSY